ncbi:MAG: 50S ribosomal protein L19 [Candidatus Gracilibacteria bacterium]|nr:50S ribosomal protein L19 [Candidatus Gracilibacteria bacterium]MDD3120485.1 50S ribosomal protein L19 [Candidatus Gracilibacteria bacterium]MDD4530529.1 50S ribosomal protein L19 [Candidatus Gracilibacteria bacterium]
MSDTKLIQEIQQEFVKEGIPDVKTGMEVIVHQKIKEGNKERIQKFKGLVIHTKGSTPLTQVITVRAIASGVGIEKIFPLNCPTVDTIEIVRQFKVRRKNIGFIRKLRGKAARLKEVKNTVTK